jgi:hypothetical protein
MHPLIVSYYTPGTAYEDHAMILKASADRQGLDSLIEPRERKSSWVENCAQKALFVRDVRRATDRPIMWVDADARILRRLKELEAREVDFAVVKRDGWCFFGGQIYFGASDAALELIERWCSYCETRPHIWDQVTLGYAWWDMAVENRPLSTLWLPDRFAWKEQVRPGKKDGVRRRIKRLLANPAILHLQESRMSREAQSNPQRSEYTSYLLPDWWRAAARCDSPFPISEGQLHELGLA